MKKGKRKRKEGKEKTGDKSSRYKIQKSIELESIVYKLGNSIE